MRATCRRRWTIRSYAGGAPHDESRRFGLASKAPILAALAEPRRTATRLAITRHLDAVAIDDALDLFALLMATKLINPARRASAAERLASLPRLERASRTLAVVNRELFTALDAGATGAAVDVAAVWAAIERRVRRDRPVARLPIGVPGRVRRASTPARATVPGERGGRSPSLGQREPVGSASPQLHLDGKPVGRRRGGRFLGER